MEEFFFSMLEQYIDMVLTDKSKLLFFIVMLIVVFVVVVMVKGLVFSGWVENQFFLFNFIENKDPIAKKAGMYIQIFFGILAVNFFISVMLGAAVVTALSIWFKLEVFNEQIGVALIVGTSIIIFSLIGFGAIKVIMRKLSEYIDKQKVHKGLIILMISFMLPYIDLVKPNTTVIVILFYVSICFISFFLAFVTQVVLRLPQKVCLTINGEDVECKYREMKFRGAYVFIKHRDQNGQLLNTHRYKSEDITKLEYIYELVFRK